MKLKCIGGPCDGYIIHTTMQYQEHDQVPVYSKVEFKLIDFEEEVKAFREGKVPDAMINPVHYYKVVVWNFSKISHLKFLIPIHWKIEDSIRHALGVVQNAP